MYYDNEHLCIDCDDTCDCGWGEERCTGCSYCVDIDLEEEDTVPEPDDVDYE